MSEMQRVRFLNPVMDSEFRKALETLALSHDTQKKAVSASTSSATASGTCASATWSRTRSGRRAIGWCCDKKEKPFLQGWAIVENPTDEDWKDVPHGPGVRPADLASRWTCTSRCTCRGPSSSPNSSPRCGRRPTAATSDTDQEAGHETPSAASANAHDRSAASGAERSGWRPARAYFGSSLTGMPTDGALSADKMHEKLARADGPEPERRLGGDAPPNWATSSSTPSTGR